MAYLKSVPKYLVEGTEENHTKLVQGRCIRGRHLKRGYPEYKIDVLGATQFGVSWFNPVHILTTNVFKIMDEKVARFSCFPMRFAGPRDPNFSDLTSLTIRSENYKTLKSSLCIS